MDQFDESRAEFKGFNTYYRDEIIQPLIIKDQKRKAMVKRFHMSLIGGGVLAIPAALGAWKLNSPHLAFFGIGGCLMGGYALGHYFLKGIKSATKEHIVGKVCRYVGLEFTAKGFMPMSLKLFRSLHLLPRADRESFEDQISGQAHGAMFTLHEAHLEKENHSDKGSKYRTVFRGVMLRMDFHQKFLGQTIIVRDSGFFNRKKKGNLKRVGLVDPVFEKAFEAYGTDQVEARYLLTPTFMQRLVDLERLFAGRKLRAAFTGGELLIAIEAPNQFEAGSMFKSLTDPARTQKILNEIGTVFDIIDGVLKPEQGRTRRG